MLDAAAKDAAVASEAAWLDEGATAPVYRKDALRMRLRAIDDRAAARINNVASAAGAPIRLRLRPTARAGDAAPVKRSWQRTLAQVRCGVCPALGGHLHDTPEACPLCKQPGAMARNGASTMHLFACQHDEARRVRHRRPAAPA